MNLELKTNQEMHMKAQKAEGGLAPSIRKTSLEDSLRLAPRPGRFTPWKDPVPNVQEAEWASLNSGRHPPGFDHRTVKPAANIIILLYV
jgi:hypothetical protein